MKNFNKFIIGKKSFNSRLMLGTGKYSSLKEMNLSIINSECNIVTVAIRRLELNNLSNKSNLINSLDWKKLWLLPNTAGAKTTEEAIRLAFLGREIAKNLGQTDNNFVKLEVISDPKYLLPDPIGTIKAAEFLVKKGFTVLPYMNADPVLAKHLEDIGCSTVMPLGSPIGSGQGINNLNNIQIIIENSNIPVIIDAGIGTPSEACLAMELGADGVLINTAIAKAESPNLMANAMKKAVIAGREGYLAGRSPIKTFAQASSTIKGVPFLT
jgi:thiazole synthase